MPLELHIVTPQGERYGGVVEGVVLPGSEGDFGVLPEHERFLTPLRIGEVQIRVGGRVAWAAIGGGFADVSGEAVTVMVDSCELAEDIDRARAELAHTRAERGMTELVSEDERRRAGFQAALARARNRLEVSGRARSGA